MARLPYFDRCDEAHERAKAYYHETGTLEGAPHGTTRGHFEKYQAMVQASGLAFTKLSLLGVNDLEDLTLRYMCPGSKGRALNSIPLRRFDNLYRAYRVYNQRPAPGAARSNAEYVCCLKHILIFHVLGLVPEFTEYT